MAQDTPDPNSGPGRAPPREDRLKSALKANIARRKAQTRARAAADEVRPPAPPGPTEE